MGCTRKFFARPTPSAKLLRNSQKRYSVLSEQFLRYFDDLKTVLMLFISLNSMKQYISTEFHFCIYCNEKSQYSNAIVIINIIWQIKTTNLAADDHEWEL